MFDCFTEESIKVIMLAQEESRRLGHSFVYTGQILLGIISEGTSVAAEILKSKGVTLEQVQIEVEKIVGHGSDFTTVDLPFSPKACRALDLAAEKAEQLKHNYLDAEHLLLGVLHVEDGNAFQVLADLGVDVTEIRDLIVQRLGENFPQKSRHARALASEARRIIDLAAEKVAQLEPSYFTAEDALIDGLSIDERILLQSLADAGEDTTEVRDLIVRGLGEGTQG